MSLVITNILHLYDKEYIKIDNGLYLKIQKDLMLSQYKFIAEREKTLVMKGEIFNYNLKDLRDFLHEKDDFYEFSKIIGEFFLIIYDKKLKILSILNDKSGREPLFYYLNKGSFIFSDNFWEIINIVNPSENDIDIQSLKEFVVFHYPLFNKTFIRNLEIFPPASAGTYDIIQEKFTIKKYWDLRYNVDEKKKLYDAVSELDMSIDSALSVIEKFNGRDKVYGVGISGGLDSRIIPFYARKHGLDLLGFIIGESKPHKIFLSRDHNNAKEIADFYNIRLHNIDIDSEPIEVKLRNDVNYYPIGTSQYIISLRDSIPRFDILLTGATGIIVGAELPFDICEMSKEDLLVKIVQHFSLLGRTGHVGKFLKFLNYVGLKKFKGHENSKFDLPMYIIKKKEIEMAVEKIDDYINKRKNKRPVDIFQEYFLHVIASKNKYGVYESIQGRQKSYSIYVPFILDISLTWSPKFLIGRKVLKELILKKVPQLSKIDPQGYKTSIRNEEHILSPFFKIGSLLDFLIRGRGVDNLDKWLYAAESVNIVKKILLQKKNKFWNDNFNTLRIYDDFINKKIHPKLLAKIVKTKYLLDVIFSKEYKKFII